MMTCNECGNELRETAKFCVNCGATIAQTADISSNEHASEGISYVSADEEAGSNLGELSLEDAEHYLFDYLDFIKENLLSPSSIFSQKNEVWIFGLVNLILYSVVLAMNTYGAFFTMFIQMLALQAAFVGVLFVVNKFLIKGTDSYLDALGKYGGMVSGQIILFLLIWFFGVDSGFGSFLIMIASIYQLLIFNVYIFESQTDEKRKVDNYYQLILSYIPFIMVMSFMFNRFL